MAQYLNEAFLIRSPRDLSSSISSCRPCGSDIQRLDFAVYKHGAPLVMSCRSAIVIPNAPGSRKDTYLHKQSSPEISWSELFPEAACPFPLAGRVGKLSQPTTYMIPTMCYLVSRASICFDPIARPNYWVEMDPQPPAENPNNPPAGAAEPPCPLFKSFRGGIIF